MKGCETLDAMIRKAKDIAVQLRYNEEGGHSLLSHDEEHSERLNANRKSRRFSSMSLNPRRFSSMSLNARTLSSGSMDAKYRNARTNEGEA